MALNAIKGAAWTALFLGVVATLNYLTYIRSDDYLLNDCMRDAKDKWVAQMCRYEHGDLKVKRDMKFEFVKAVATENKVDITIRDNNESQHGTLTLHNDDIAELREAFSWHAEELTLYALLNEAEKTRLAAIDRIAANRLEEFLEQ